MGLTEEQYTVITYETPLRFAEALVALNPGMVFCHLSGAGTDGTEAGRLMWARVKGREENTLLRLPFKAVYNFRPGLMKPAAGQRNVKGVLKAAAALYPVLRLVTAGLTMSEVGRAMIHAAAGGAPTNVLEAKDMKTLAARGGATR